MVILKQFDTELLICLSESFIIYNIVTYDTKITHIPDLNLEVSKKQPLQENENRAISSACYSKSGDLFAISAGKQVLVYKKDLTIIKTFILQRTASKIRFTHQNDILIADKTGDAYLCKFSDAKNEACLLLGHLSMLLDISLTDNNKFIITCDRDEKIRVSCYPNCYNIMSYCLGHKEFVTNIEIVGEYLISASGDGTIKFWEFMNGEQIHTINTNDFIDDKDLIDNFCKEMDEEKCEVTSLPIVDMQTHKADAYCYIAVSLHNYKNIQIYTVQIVEKNIDCTFYRNIILNNVPLCFSFTNNLYILTEENLIMFYFNDGRFLENKSEHLIQFYNKNKDLLCQSDNAFISVLYKRKFDNVQEYLNRKKQRLEAKIHC